MPNAECPKLETCDYQQFSLDWTTTTDFLGLYRMLLPRMDRGCGNVSLYHFFFNAVNSRMTEMRSVAWRAGIRECGCGSCEERDRVNVRWHMTVLMH